MEDHAFQLNRNEIKRLSTLVADRLEEMIQTAALKPGEHLVQNDLAARFGVSRVAIRDALQELRRRGLAIDVPQKGVVVRPVSYKTIAELFAVRRVIEGFAVREACKRMGPPQWKELARLLKEQVQLAKKKDLAQLVEADGRFHEAIYRWCDNEPAREFIASLWARIKQVRSLARVQTDWGRQWARHSIARHRAILAALRRRDADTAEQLVAAAIDGALAELIEGLRESDWGVVNNHAEQ
ncbi:MAG: GntR family transcriptional regulator [Candidatus Sumerlaeia bacterium]|nr:GntR family transcriptional regulator [Candidatus Sumerlaeia bacterium]